MNPLPVVLTGTRSYDGTVTAASTILSVSNAVPGDEVYVTSGSATLTSASIGADLIFPTDGDSLTRSSKLNNGLPERSPRELQCQADALRFDYSPSDFQKHPPGTKGAPPLSKRSPVPSQRTPLPCQKQVQQNGVAPLACTGKTLPAPDGSGFRFLTRYSATQCNSESAKRCAIRAFREF